MSFPQEYAESPLWIPVNADKTPMRGSSIKPVGTLHDIQEYPGALTGFCFTEKSGLVGIDLDDCVADDGELSELANAVISLLPPATYVEYSLSGKGLHIIGTNVLSIAGWKNRPGIEMYNRGRYFIITGTLYNSGYQGGPFTDISVAVNYLLGNCGTTPTYSNGYQGVTEDDLERVKKALETLDPDADYTTWSRYGLAMGNSFKGTEFADDALKIFGKWSAKSKKFNKAAKNSISSFFDPLVPPPPNGLTIATIFADAPEILIEERITHNIALLDDVDCPTVGHGGTPSGKDESVPPDDDDVPRGTSDIPPTLSYVLHPTQIAEEFLRASHCFTVNGKFFSLWDSCRWILGQDSLYILHLVKEFIFLRGYNLIPLKGGGLIPTVNLKTKDLNEVLNQVKVVSVRLTGSLPRPNSWLNPAHRSSDPYVIPCRNGLYSIKEGRIVSELTPAFYNTGVLPCDYDATATCPRFLEGLSLTFAGDNTQEDVKDNIDSLQLWFGYLFLVGRNEKKIAVLLGDADSGKSTLLRIQEMLVGEDYYKALSAGALEGRRTDFGGGFDTHFLGGYDEFPFDKKMNSLGEILKLCTGGVRIEQRKLYSDSTTVEVRMRFVFTSNVSPDYFSDPKGGLMNRLLIWRCSAIPREKLDRGYLEYLSKEELSGILNWAIKGASRLLCGEALRQAGGASQLLHDDFRDSTRGFLEQWLEDRFIEDPEGIVSNNDLAELFRNDCGKDRRWQSMGKWFLEKPWAEKTLISKLRRAVQDCVFPQAKDYKYNRIYGLKGLRLRTGAETA